MPRPHRNPTSRAECDENFRWLVTTQVDLPPAERDPQWEWNAAWQPDRGVFYRDEPYRDVVWPEQAAVMDRLRAREPRMDNNSRMFRDYPEVPLEKIPEGPKIARDFVLPPFRVDYDTHEQINQKLNNSVILIKNFPAVVVQTGEKKGKFFLHVRGKGFDGIVPYDEIKDCRGIAPGYFAYRGNAHWIYRLPERQNSQGMNHRNTYQRLAGQQHVTGARHEFLQEALAFAKDIPFAPNIGDIMLANGSQSMRLSHRVALYLTNKKGAPIGVEYCGRPLGLIVHDRCKVLDENDLQPTWISKDLNEVNLELIA